MEINIKEMDSVFNIDLCEYEAKVNGNTLTVENFLNDVPKDDEKGFCIFGKIDIDKDVITISRHDEGDSWEGIINYILRYYESIGFEFLMTYKKYHNE